MRQLTLITSAQLLTLNSSPLAMNLMTGEVVPAQGFVLIHGAWLIFKPGTTPYTISGSNYFVLAYAGVPPAGNFYVTGGVQAAGLVDQTQITRGRLLPVSCIPQIGQATIYLECPGTANLSAGNGTITLALDYSVHPG